MVFVDADAEEEEGEGDFDDDAPSHIESPKHHSTFGSVTTCDCC